MNEMMDKTGFLQSRFFYNFKKGEETFLFTILRFFMSLSRTGEYGC